MANNLRKPKCSTFFDKIAHFLHQEPAGGILLFIAAALALIAANSPLELLYNNLKELPVSIQISTFSIAKPLLLWVNDGLMALFFFLVGLELKREFLEGELADKRNIVLPFIAAIGGIVVPALLYYALNHEVSADVKGWAIPAATDIAFALGVLALLGSRIPASLKLLLTSIAVFDDIGAVIIIALFYTSSLSLLSLAIAVACCAVLYILNTQNVTEKSVYLLIGIIMWAALLKSGVHATLSGVVLAMFIPIKDFRYPETDEEHSPLRMLENDLHNTVAFFVLPIFAFCNAGINFSGTGLNNIIHPVPLGIAAGLFLGKQAGVFGFCWLSIKSGLAQMPKGASWIHIYGIATLCGIGFTMSLFIASLAFDGTDISRLFDERTGILLGSLLSGLWGYAILRYGIKSVEKTDT